jgi:hypothetical protein
MNSNLHKYGHYLTALPAVAAIIMQKMQLLDQNMTIVMGLLVAMFGAAHVAAFVHASWLARMAQAATSAAKGAEQATSIFSQLGNMLQQVIAAAPTAGGTAPVPTPAATPATGVSKQAIVLCAFVGGGAAAATGVGTAACTPAEISTVKQDATQVAPYLQDGCALANDVPAAASYLDLLCAAEAADAALQKLPGATIVPPAPVGALVRVRVRLPPRDAGAGPLPDARE